MFVITFIPYITTGLYKYLSAHQLDIHVHKHHQAYVDYLNKNIPGSIFENKTIEEIIKSSEGAMFNNAGQHFNHDFFWNSLSDDKYRISEKVFNYLANKFGSFENFKNEFTSKASTIFGSGWCYLEYDIEENDVRIAQYPNANNPIKSGFIPLLCVDTWEHAWYIDYENRKADYFNNFWDYVNWKFVEEKMTNAKII